MRVLIDGDAFPNIKEIVELCKKNQKEVYIFVDFSHEINLDYAKIIYVSQGANAVDTALENYIEKEDLILTQDYGVAIIGLGLGGVVVHPNGFLYHDYNIDYLMEVKSENYKKRKHLHIKGPRKRTEEDKNKLLNLIDDLIKK